MNIKNMLNRLFLEGAEAPKGDEFLDNRDYHVSRVLSTIRLNCAHDKIKDNGGAAQCAFCGSYFATPDKEI